MLGSRSSICFWAGVVFATLYVAALTIWAIGPYGFFGAARAPLSVVFLIPLGVRWIDLLDNLPLADTDRIWIALLAPAINLCVLWGAGAACRRLPPPAASQRHAPSITHETGTRWGTDGRTDFALPIHSLIR